MSNYPLSEYQQFLLRTIYKLREKGYGYRRISHYLNERDYKTTRGKLFKNNHVSEMIKKYEKRIERRRNSYEVELKGFYLEIE